MGKSRSKSNNRSISRWLLAPFKSSAERIREPASNEEPPSATQKSNSRSQNEERPKRRSRRREDMSRTSEDSASASASASAPPSPNPEKGEKKEGGKEREKEKGKEQKSDEAGAKTKKKEKVKDENKDKDEPEGSIFEEVDGETAPVQTGTHGVKNKMRWKIDVEPVDVNGDQKMPEVLEKLNNLRKKAKVTSGDVDNEELIVNSARVLQLIKLETLINKELSESEHETLKLYCRSGDQEEKAEGLIEKITLSVLNSVVAKNEFIRQISTPGQLRMFAVDEKKAKIPMMALLMGRKDLLYVSWTKPNKDVEKELDSTWNNMAMRKNAEQKSVPLA
uniref:Uncharacterized protein n=1 Tax=Caenorhabditis japonica TaxID=281687 RepID=A0A8R1DWM8_CAEJA